MPDPAATRRTDQVISAEMQRRQEREASYRQQALRLYPWICGRCGREFSPVNVRQLTVHHRDHNHDNNPTDGSNWELLCVYCHDNEHARQLDAEAARQAGLEDLTGRSATHATSQPFANLKELLNNKRK